MRLHALAARAAAALGETDGMLEPAQARFRLWTHQSGSQAGAALVGATETHFTLRNPAGREITLPIAVFIEDDQRIIRAFEP